MRKGPLALVLLFAVAGNYGAWHVDPAGAEQERHTAAKESEAPVDAASAESDDLPIDPVCGMLVPPPEAKAAGRVTEYKGKTYFFCANMCKQRFDANPAAYLAKPGQGGMGAGE